MVHPPVALHCLQVGWTTNSSSPEWAEWYSEVILQAKHLVIICLFSWSCEHSERNSMRAKVSYYRLKIRLYI